MRLKKLFSLLLLGSLLSANVMVADAAGVSTSCSGAPAFSGTSIYVNSAAGSGGTGTLLNPYATVSQASTRLAADATVTRVCFKGTFTEKLNVSGAAAQRLELNVYGTGATFNFSSAYSSPYTVIYADGASTLNRLVVGNIKVVTATGATGLEALNLTSLELSNVRIEKTAGGRAIKARDITTVTMDGSYLDGSSVGFDTQGSTSITNLTITDSTFINQQWSGTFISDVTNVDVERNIFQDAGNQGVRFMGVTTLELYNNTFVNCDDATSISSSYSPVLDAKIYHNSYYNNQSAIYLGDEIHADVQNNIFYSSTGGAAYAMRSGDSHSWNLNSESNLFYGDALYDYDTTDSLNLTDWESDYGYDASSFEADPLFVSSTDLHIGTSSPAVDAGASLSGPTTDMDLQTRDSQPDIGADEVL